MNVFAVLTYNYYVFPFNVKQFTDTHAADKYFILNK